MVRTSWTAEAVDDVLAGTFPASDPPAWTPGIARPAPKIAEKAADTGTAPPTHSKRTFAQGLMSLLGVAGLALLVPVAVLAIGTPVALAVRGLLEISERILAFIR